MPTIKPKKKKFKCVSCKNDYNIGDINVVEGNEYCVDCLQKAKKTEELIFCISCNDWGLHNNFHYYNRQEIYVCNRCFENLFYVCNLCDYIERNERICQCQTMLNETPADSNTIKHRKFNKKCRTFISQKGEFGKIIRSSRKFGVEIELFHQKRKPLLRLYDMLSKDFGLDHDGSILDENGNRHPNEIEVVTPPMSGLRGEEGLKKVLEQINDKGFETNESCGLHVHFSADEFKNKTEVFLNQVKDINEKNYKPNLPRFIIKKDLMQYLSSFCNIDTTIEIIDKYIGCMSSNRIDLAKKMGVNFSNKYKNIFIDEKFDKINMNESKINRVFKVFSPTDDELKNAESGWFKFMDSEGEKGNNNRYPTVDIAPDDFFCQVYKKDNLQNLKTLFYLYTAYQDVFLMMLPKSRREKNSKVQKLTSKFSLRDIEMLQNYDELESLWFKTSDSRQKRAMKSNKYDDSRYYGFNLHTLFGKYGTVEIRHHDGTTDINNILYWISLHQTIIDKVASGEVDIFALVNGADLFSREEKIEYLINILNLRKGLRNYINAKINHFKNN